MVNVKYFDIKEIPEGEILRYMRAGKSPSSDILDCVRDISQKISDAARCACVYERLAVEIDGARVRIGGVVIDSQNVSKRLSECSEAFVFCATVGVGVDREIKRQGALSPFSELCADACGSALVEEVCDGACELFSEFCRVTPRFSPGYGDFSIEYQKDIIKLLDTSKHIGVSLTDGGMMTPQKSITAIVGVINKVEK